MSIVKDKIVVKPFGKGLKPGLSFSLKIEVTVGKVIITQQRGELWIGGTLISHLIEQPTIKSFSFNHFRDCSNNFLLINFYCELEQEAIAYIETERQKRPKKDVQFTIKVFTDILKSSLNKDNLPTAVMAGGFAALANGIFKYARLSESVSKVISGNDWVHDFVPHLKIGEFMIFELPVPRILPNSDFLSSYLNKCTEAILDMKKHYLRGEWNDMILASRPVWEAPKNKKIEQIKKILEGSGYQDELLENYQSLFNALFDIGSKHTHILARYQGNNSNRTLLPEAPSYKEDAILMYSLAVNFTNLLAKKYQRMNSNEDAKGDI